MLDHILAKNFAGVAFRLHTKDAVADLGATQIFIMEGTPVINKRATTRPLKVTLSDGRQVMSTHMWDIIIKGLTFMLTGHIIPDLSIASLFGIRVLTKAGCEVTFDKHTCKVWYNGNDILTGQKDPATNLWTLSLETLGMSSQHVPNILPLAAPVIAKAHAHLAIQISFFTHRVQTKANSICFAHQLLCSLQISTLLKAI
jgi:hypothetical protein